VGFSLLYRQLPVREAGLMALLLSLSDILGILALLGLGSVITRLYSAAGPGVFDWRRDLLRTAGYLTPAVALAVWGVSNIYDFTVEIVAYLFLLTVLGSLLGATYSMLNSQGHYAWSAFLVRAPNSALLIPGLAGLWLASSVRLGEALAVYLGATLIALLIGIAILLRVLPAGARRISGRERLNGAVFMGTLVTDLLPDQGLIAVAGKILPLGQVAAFAAVAIFIRPFRLVRGILAMILTPDLLRYRRASYRKLVTGVWTLALLCGLATAVLIPPLASRFYGDRYQEAIGWIPIMALAGVLLVGVVPARSDLAARSPIGTMGGFALAYFGSMMVSLGIGIAGMLTWGAAFLPFAVVLLQATECAVGYGFWFSFRRRERTPGPPEPVNPDQPRRGA
jgi:O-antigen/teichoic acid export membrane protein